MQSIEVLALLKGGGAQKVSTLQQFSHFVPLPVINDQSIIAYLVVLMLSTPIIVITKSNHRLHQTKNYVEGVFLSLATPTDQHPVVPCIIQAT